ncbi:Amino acid permease [Giardia duodenalis assemblage B]|uniref:Amino acid permease n=1 Tax=Giardia duodenalis assemblage B TaxID=1394984 RepID=A0A132NW20_GIAIN|nr:Amino acid permease [Giardia intestinalis assemblage B]
MVDFVGQIAVLAPDPGKSKQTKAGPREIVKRVGMLELIVVGFFMVSAGPFGIEEAINAGGPLATIIAIVVAPLFISVPLALMSAELSTLFPCCGSPIDWTADMGHFISSCNGYCRLLFTILDNPLYAASVTDYLTSLFNLPNKLWLRLIFSFIVYALVTVLNCFGIEIVNWFSILLSVVIILPFFIFFGAAAPQFTTEKIFAARPFNEIDWVGLVSTSVWLYSGYDCMGSLANDVRNPRKVYPVGLLITVLIVTLVYLFPTIAGLSLDMDNTKWMNGAFVEAAKLLSIDRGRWLSTWIGVGGVVSNVAILNVDHFCSAMEIYAMAENNMLVGKKYLMKQYITKKGEPIPRVAIIVLAILCFPLGMLDFSVLIDVNGLMTALSLFFQTMGFLYARYGRNGIIRRMQRAPTINQYTTRETIEAITSAAHTDTMKVGIPDILHNKEHDPNGRSNDHSSPASNVPPNTAGSLEQPRSAADMETVSSNPANAAQNILDETAREMDSASKDANLPWVVNHPQLLHASADNDLYRIPCGIVGVLLVTVPAFLVCIFIAVISGWKPFLFTIVFVALCFAINAAAGAIARCVERRKAKRIQNSQLASPSFQLARIQAEFSANLEDGDERNGFSHAPYSGESSIPLSNIPPSVTSLR